MRIVCDQHIPFLVDAIQRHWPDVQIHPMKSEQITPSAVCDADVLVVRTRTRIDKQLLANSHVRLVCTATIGYDHIDTAYCDSHHIRWMACPGCNAQAVCDYIEEAITAIPFGSNSTIGVVGVGHVGSLVVQMATRKGYHVLLNDPPKGIGVSLDSIAQNCDIITFHTPLVRDGEYPTYHLCNEAFLRLCKTNALIINAARGGIVDEQALLHSGRPYILDTWENEPHINQDVLAHALRASMHIAGYSLHGKITATQMCLDAIAQAFNLPPITTLFPATQPQGDKAPGWLERITYQLKTDPGAFELLRSHYLLR